MISRLIIAATGTLLLSSLADAAELKVLSTQATEEAYRELVPQFEKDTGHKVTTVFTGTLDANKRLAAGETYDLLIMSGPSIEPQPSVPMLTFTPASRSARTGARPEPTLRLEAGLCCTVTPVLARISISRGLSQTP